MTAAFCGCRGSAVGNLVPLLEARRVHKFNQIGHTRGEIVLQVAAET